MGEVLLFYLGHGFEILLVFGFGTFASILDLLETLFFTDLPEKAICYYLIVILFVRISSVCSCKSGDWILDLNEYNSISTC